MNKEVRHAFEITADELVLTDEANQFLAAFSKHVSSSMFAGQPVTLQLNKLNVYPKGGKFKAHIDTPRDGMIGTVVVDLAYKYSVGRVRFRASFSASRVARFASPLTRMASRTALGSSHAPAGTRPWKRWRFSRIARTRCNLLSLSYPNLLQGRGSD